MDSDYIPTPGSTVKFAYYKPKWNDVFGQLIAWYTRLFNWSSKGYSHVEIGFMYEGKRLWFSSASKNKNGPNGVRYIDEKDLFIHPERWDIKTYQPLFSDRKMKETADSLLGKPYDWAGLFGFIEPFDELNAKNKWYCSEVCYRVFFGVWKKRVSPERLDLETARYQIKAL